jgi:hypothetical protein
MTQKRKAELQRKLSIAPVPRPPDGLADEIKKNIPDLRALERERARFSRSILLSAGVAASVLLLFSSAFITLQLLSPVGEEVLPPGAVTQKKSDIPLPITPPPQARPEAQMVDTVVPAVQKRPEVASNVPIQVARRREDDVVVAAAPQPAPPAAPASVVADAMTVTAENMERRLQEAEAPAQAGARSNEGAPEVAAEAPARFAKTAVVSGDLKREETKALFSFSVDASAFDRVKEAIERGEKPAPEIVDVSAIVNYFAGAGTPRREVELEVEGSRGPVPHANESLVRFSVDTRTSDRRGTPQGPAVATNLLLVIEPNREAVADYRFVGGGTSLSLAQPVLMRNASVTGVMEVDLKPDVSRNTVVMTFHLSYRSVATMRTDVQVGRIRAWQVRESWLRASRRHRLATLGAVWSETLRGTSAGAEVARTAEELATEKPEDSRARELAAAATASYRLRISGSTGSGR